MNASFFIYSFYILAILHLFIVVRKSQHILSYRKAPQNRDTNGFTVIVAARNEAENLKRLLPLLLAQNYPKFEIIIALDRCDDQSLQVVNSFSDKRLAVLDIQDVPGHYHGKKFALTRAIKAANHEWILMTDADCRPISDQWIASYSESITDSTDIILGVSPYYKHVGLLNALIQYETLQTGHSYISAAASGNPYMGVGRNMAYRKSLFIHSGGFGRFASVTGGDDDLFVQANATAENTALLLDTNSLTYSAPKRTWSEYLKQKIRHLSVGKHYKAKLKWMHFLSASVHALLWLSFLYLIFNYPDRWRIFGVFSLLLMVKGLFFMKIANKTGLHYSIAWYPIVDFLFAILMPLTGIGAVFVKKIKWS